MGKDKDQIETLYNGCVIQERFLKVLGIWPSNTNDFATSARFVFAVALCISYIYALSMEIHLRCFNVDETMDAFVMTLACVVTAFKLIINRMNWEYMLVLINSVAEDWATVKDYRHQREMTKYFRRGRIIYLMLLYMCYLTGPSYIIKANSFDELIKQQILKYFTGSTGNTSTVNYMLLTTCVYGPMPTYLFIGSIGLQALQVAVMVMTQCGNDGLFFSLTMHLSGQFDVLSMNLQEMRFEELDCRRKLGLLVKRHCHLCMLTNSLEKGFNTIVLLQLFMSTLVMCAEGFVLLINLEAGDNIGTLKSALMILTMIIQLYIYAYVGETLESRAEGVATAAYSSPWYLSRDNSSKDVILIINRGNLLCHVTAGKFVSLNRFTFKEVIKTSASYLSVLRVMMKT